MNPLPTVLIVEDDLDCQAKFAAELGGKVEIIMATTVEDARKIMSTHQVSLVVLDACVPGNVPNTLQLVPEWRLQSFSNPVIGISSIRIFRDLLKEVGCELTCEKQNVTQIICQVLHLG